MNDESDSAYESDGELLISVALCPEEEDSDPGVSLKTPCNLCESLEKSWKRRWKIYCPVFIENTYLESIDFFHNSFFNYRHWLEIINSYQRLYDFLAHFDQPTNEEQRKFWLQFESHLCLRYRIPPGVSPASLILKQPRLVIHRKQQPQGHSYLDLSVLHSQLHVGTIQDVFV